MDTHILDDIMLSLQSALMFDTHLMYKRSTSSISNAIFPVLWIDTFLKMRSQKDSIKTKCVVKCRRIDLQN